jgi:hypothetical protein
VQGSGRVACALISKIMDCCRGICPEGFCGFVDVGELP